MCVMPVEIGVQREKKGLCRGRNEMKMEKWKMVGEIVRSKIQKRRVCGMTRRCQEMVHEFAEKVTLTMSTSSTTANGGVSTPLYRSDGASQQCQIQAKSRIRKQ